jgi:hypothetical protein
MLVWALFKIITFGESGMFYSCLNRLVGAAVVRELWKPTAKYPAP